MRAGLVAHFMETSLEVPYGTNGQISDVPFYVKKTSLCNAFKDLVIAINPSCETPETHGMVYQYAAVYDPDANTISTDYETVLNEYISTATFSVTWPSAVAMVRNLADKGIQNGSMGKRNADELLVKVSVIETDLHAVNVHLDTMEAKLLKLDKVSVIENDLQSIEAKLDKVSVIESDLQSIENKLQRLDNLLMQVLSQQNHKSSLANSSVLFDVHFSTFLLGGILALVVAVSAIALLWSFFLRKERGMGHAKLDENISV